MIENDEIKILLNKAIEKIDQGKDADAIVLLDKALKVDPDDCDVLYHCGMSKYRMAYRDESKFLVESMEAAVADFDRVVERNPEKFEAYYFRGIAKETLGKVDEALIDFKKASELKPYASSCQKKLGEMHLELGEYREAITALEKVLELNPDEDAEDYFLLAVAHKEIGDYEEAIEYFTMAIETNEEVEEEDPELYCLRGLSYSALNQFALAIEDFKVAIELDPDNIECWGERGVAQFKNKDYKEALNDLNHAIINSNRLDFEDFDYIYYRGRAKAQLEDFKGAIEDYNIAIEKNPNPSYDIYNDRSFALFQAGAFEASINDMKQVMKLRNDI